MSVIPQRSPITGEPATVRRRGDEYDISSPVEGSYSVSGTLFVTAASEVPAELKHRLVAAVRRASEAGQPLSLHTGNVIEVAETEPDVSPADLLDNVLDLVYERSATAGETVTVSTGVDYPLVGARHASALAWASEASVAQGLTTAQRWKGEGGPVFALTLTPAGWQRIRELREAGRDTDQAFVAMWFDDEQMGRAWPDGIRPAFDGTGWKPLRIDAVEHNDRIDARIVAEINRSGLLVADVTGGRQGVYFEAGYAIGRGLPVIWTVRKDYLSAVHFDTRQYNHVVWETPAELCEKLQYRILATAPRPGRSAR